MPHVGANVKLTMTGLEHMQAINGRLPSAPIVALMGMPAESLRPGEADFHPCSYGFRPGRRAHDAGDRRNLIVVRGGAPAGVEAVAAGRVVGAVDRACAR